MTKETEAVGGDVERSSDSTDQDPGSVAERLRLEIAARRSERDDDTREEIMQAEVAARERADVRARAEADEKARMAAEEASRRRAEDVARQLAEASVRHQAEEEARRAAEEQSRLDAEAEARRVVEEKARRKAEEAAKLEAEAQARKAEEQKALDALRERIRLRNERRRKMLLNPLTMGVTVAIVIGLAILHLMSFDGKRSEFETVASQMLGVPVRAASAHLVLLPAPRWTFNNVTIGEGADMARIERVALSGLFGRVGTPDAIHLDAPQIPLAVFLKALHGQASLSPLKSSLTASGLIFAGDRHAMPPLSVQATINGSDASFSARGDDGEYGKVSIDGNTLPATPGQWHISVTTPRFLVPFGVGVPLENFSMNVVIAPGMASVKEFSGRFHEGQLGGSAEISWAKNWRASARIEAKNIDAAKLLPGWAKDGLISGQGELLAEAATANELVARARTVGRFSVGRGTLVGVDLDRVIQGRGVGDQFRFESLSGDLLMEAGKIDLSSLRLASENLSAQGSLTLLPDQAVKGRLIAEIKAPTSRVSAAVTVGGTLKVPQYQR